MASPSIVVINATVTVAPAPNNLQSRGAIVSQGATTLAPGTFALLTQVSDATPLLTPAQGITSITWSGGLVTVQTALPIPGLDVGNGFLTTIAGAVPTGYNGLQQATVTGPSSFTFPLATNPGAITSSGTYTVPSQNGLINKLTDFYAQGTNQAVYVLELGPGDATAGANALATFIQGNSTFFYAYLVPGSWDSNAAYLALVSQYEAPTSKTYFFTTTTLANYANYTSVMKSVVAVVEAPGAPITEFTAAALFQHALSYAPNTTNRMTPFAFSFLFDVTPWPPSGQDPALSALKLANINYVGTGAEGGLSNTILFWGKTLDGQDFSWWYSADYIQVNADRNVANAVISGSQNSLNPLVYDQNGIDRLQDTVVSTVTQAISFGLATGTVTRTTLDPATFQNNLSNGVYAGQNVVNAVPFTTYVAQEPNDYPIGKYAGLSIVYLPQNGFQQIVININVTNLLTQ